VRQRGAGTCGTVDCCCEREGQTHTGRRRFEQQTQTFKATLPGLAELGGWLAEAGVTLVGMEATGVYWKTVFQALEDRFECWLLNAHHLRSVPGRKTDVKDSEWICQLVQHGLARPSFVPPPEIRRLRDLTRLRTALNNERTTDDPAAGEGAPGRRDQDLERRLQELLEVRPRDARGAALRCHRPRAARRTLQRERAKQLREALASRFTIEHHGVMVAQLLAHIDTLDTELEHLTGGSSWCSLRTPTSSSCSPRSPASKPWLHRS
jgi:transposase